MKYNINGFLIVEGTTDKAFLGSFLNCEIVYVGGNALPRGTMDYLLQLSRVSQPIIMTDPDVAGERIKARLMAAIPNAQSALININPLQIGKKNGVAESTKKEVLRVLKPYIVDTPLKVGNWTTNDLIMLGLDDKNLRNYIQKTLEIGISNLKTLANKLNYLNITRERIEEIIKTYGN